MELINLQPKYYTVQQIKQLENCGRDKAYEIARSLPHEKRGTQYYVFVEDYEMYYQEKRQKILKNNSNNVYELQKFR